MDPALERIIAQDPDHAPTLRERPATVTATALPFYRKTRLLEVVVELPHRPLTLTYTDDGKSVVPLAEERDLQRVNHAEGLILAASQLEAYLGFYLFHARRARLVQRSEDVPWLAGAGEARAAVEPRLRPLTHERKLSAFVVTAMVLTGQTLEEKTLQVEVNGAVKELASAAVAEGLPVSVGV